MMRSVLKTILDLMHVGNRKCTAECKYKEKCIRRRYGLGFCFEKFEKRALTWWSVLKPILVIILCVGFLGACGYLITREHPQDKAERLRIEKQVANLQQVINLHREFLNKYECEYAKESNLVPINQYRDQVTRGYVKGRISGGMFLFVGGISGRLDGMINTDNIQRLGFAIEKNKGTAKITELPISKVNFVFRKTGQPTIKIHLSQKAFYYLREKTFLASLPEALYEFISSSQLVKDSHNRWGSNEKYLLNVWFEQEWGDLTSIGPDVRIYQQIFIADTLDWRGYADYRTRHIKNSNDEWVKNLKMFDEYFRKDDILGATIYMSKTQFQKEFLNKKVQ